MPWYSTQLLQNPDIDGWAMVDAAYIFTIPSKS
jgi:hypothetical protein